MEAKFKDQPIGELNMAQVLEHMATRGMLMIAVVIDPKEQNADGDAATACAISAGSAGREGYAALLGQLPELIGLAIHKIPAGDRPEFMAHMLPAVFEAAANRDDNPPARSRLAGPSVN